MVNNKPLRLRQIPEKPEVLTKNNRSLGRMPLYDLNVVKELVALHGVVLINENAQLDASHQLQMSPSQVAKFISFLQTDHYQNSQWCDTSVNRPLDCDSYGMRYNRNLEKPQDNMSGIYVKFGFFSNISRAVVCSLHFDR